MDLSAIIAFTAVATRKSFSGAAAELHLTQPAVSKRISALEEELGIDLFHRVARQVTLTEAGRQLLPKAQELIEQADDMKRFAMNLSTGIGGKLSFGIAHHVGLYRMPPVLKAFSANYPQVSLDIHFEDSDEALNRVDRGDLELAVITLPSALPDSLNMELIWRDPLEFVIGRQHPLAKLGSIRKTDLFHHPCVLAERNSETYRIVTIALQEGETQLNEQMLSNNLESLKMLVAAGIGWSALPRSMVDDSLSVLHVGIELERQLGIVLHKKRSLSNAATALIELIRAHSQI